MFFSFWFSVSKSPSVGKGVINPIPDMDASGDTFKFLNFSRPLKHCSS